MFPVNETDAYRKSDGSLTTMGEAIESGGGGDPYVLPPATANTLGGVKIGNGVDVTEDGTISVSDSGSMKYSATELNSIISDNNDHVLADDAIVYFDSFNTNTYSISVNGVTVARITNGRKGGVLFLKKGDTVKVIDGSDAYLYISYLTRT